MSNVLVMVYIVPHWSTNNPASAKVDDLLGLFGECFDESFDVVLFDDSVVFLVQTTPLRTAARIIRHSNLLIGGAG